VPNCTGYGECFMRPDLSAVQKNGEKLNYGVEYSEPSSRIPRSAPAKYHV